MGGRRRKPEQPREWQQFAELPPRPDPQTGEPEPPHAPLFTSADSPAQENLAYDRWLIGKPAPPPGMGPVLVWHRESAKIFVFRFLLFFIVLIVGSGIISLLNDFQLRAYGYWQLWAIIVTGALLSARPWDLKTVSVGADWLQVAPHKRWFRRSANRNYLKLYELVEIKGLWLGSSVQLHLKDADGRGMYRLRGELQPDRRTWNLVYNGILHSVANGAATNKVSEDLLRLHDTPALGLRDGGDPA